MAFTEKKCFHILICKFRIYSEQSSLYKDGCEDDFTNENKHKETTGAVG